MSRARTPSKWTYEIASFMSLRWQANQELFRLPRPRMAVQHLRSSRLPVTVNGTDCRRERQRAEVSSFQVHAPQTDTPKYHPSNA